MKTLSYWVLGVLVVFGVILPSVFLFRLIFHTLSWERDQYPLILLCLTVWMLVGLVVSCLSGKQIVETLARADEIAERRAAEKEIRAEQKQNETEKLRLTVLEKLVSLQKENPAIEKIKELYDLLKPESQASNS